jgi:hypothetical protein
MKKPRTAKSKGPAHITLVSNPPKLPVEIYNIIIDAVASEPHLSVVLPACALTARALRARSQMHLFKCFTLKSEHALHRLAEVFADSPHLAKHPRRAKLCGLANLPSSTARKAAAAVLAACSKLETLSLNGYPNAIKPSFLIPVEDAPSGALSPDTSFSLPSVTRLEIFGCGKLDINIFEAAVWYLPSLRALMIRAGSIAESVHHAPIAPTPPRMLAELDILAFAALSDDSIHRVRCTIGAVETLYLSLDYEDTVEFSAKTTAGCFPLVKELTIGSMDDSGTYLLPCKAPLILRR